MSTRATLSNTENPPTEILASHERTILFEGLIGNCYASKTPNTAMSLRNDLLTLLATRSAKRGTFTLASGRQSSLYIDARMTTMSPEGIAAIGPLGLEAIRTAQWAVDSVGGLTMGADPIACAISYASATTAEPLRAFTVRKEPKTHGTGKLIEGPFQTGDRVVIIEDTITTGGSAQKAINAVRAAGGIVTGVLALVDREEGGREALARNGVDVLSLARASEIVPLIPG
jgi:orotate phosphoribosyltransferase